MYVNLIKKFFSCSLLTMLFVHLLLAFPLFLSSIRINLNKYLSSAIPSAGFCVFYDLMFVQSRKYFICDRIMLAHRIGVEDSWCRRLWYVTRYPYSCQNRKFNGWREKQIDDTHLLICTEKHEFKSRANPKPYPNQPWANHGLRVAWVARGMLGFGSRLAWDCFRSQPRVNPEQQRATSTMSSLEMTQDSTPSNPRGSISP